MAVTSGFSCPVNSRSMGAPLWWQTKGQVKSPTALEGQKPVIISRGWSLDPGPLHQGRQRRVITAKSLASLHCQSNCGWWEQRGGAVFPSLNLSKSKVFPLFIHPALPHSPKAYCVGAFTLLKKKKSLFSHYFHLFPPLQLQTSLSSPRPRNGVIGSGGRVKKESLLAFSSPLAAFTPVFF